MSATAIYRDTSLEGVLSWADPASVRDTGLEAIDKYAGAGGMSTAAEAAGIRIHTGMNHWSEAIRVYADNHPGANVELTDITRLDPRSFPRGFVQAMFCSPECTTFSLARNQAEALAGFGEWDPQKGIERSRCCMWTPLVWAAYHRFLFVIVENVVEVGAKFNRWNEWVQEWEKIGYRCQTLYLNSAFFGSPQSRDRLYHVAVRADLPFPDLDFEYLSWCFDCQQVVRARQRWKKKVGGKYGPRHAQYFMACPHCQGQATPFVPPAWTAIDRTIPAERIGDREKPLAEKTLARIRLGIEREARNPFTFSFSYLAEPRSKRERPMWLPAPTLTGRSDTGLVNADMLQLALRQNAVAHSTQTPWATLAASGNHLAIVGANNENNVPRAADAAPAPTVTTGGRLFHVGQPGEQIAQVAGNTFERPGRARVRSTTAAPSFTATTTLSHALVGPPPQPGDEFIVGCYSPGWLRDSTREPLGTLTTGGVQGMPQQAVAATPSAKTMVVSGQSTGRSRDAQLEPFPTMLPGGDASVAPVSVVNAPDPAVLVDSYYGVSCGGRTSDEPVGTLTTKDRHAVVAPPEGMMVPAGGTRQDRATSLHEPSPTRMTRDSHAIVMTPAGPVDINQCTFRMLSPGEAQATMSLTTHFDGKPYRITGSNAVRVKLCGNAVTPPTVAAIARRCVAAVCEGVGTPPRARARDRVRCAA